MSAGSSPGAREFINSRFKPEFDHTPSVESTLNVDHPERSRSAEMESKDFPVLPRSEHTLLEKSSSGHQSTLPEGNKTRRKVHFGVEMSLFPGGNRRIRPVKKFDGKRSAWKTFSTSQ